MCRVPSHVGVDLWKQVNPVQTHSSNVATNQTIPVTSLFFFGTNENLFHCKGTRDKFPATSGLGTGTRQDKTETETQPKQANKQTETLQGRANSVQSTVDQEPRKVSETPASRKAPQTPKSRGFEDEASHRTTGLPPGFVVDDLRKNFVTPSPVHETIQQHSVGTGD